MLKRKNILGTILVLVVFAMFALGSGESDTVKQDDAAVQQTQADNESIGDYTVVIDSCRLAKDYDKKSVVIVKYIFTNVADEEPTAFFTAFDDAVYQDGVGLNNAYILADNAKYSADNQTKEIKKGASIEVEVAYELNDTKTDIEVEVSELFSFNDKKITRTFSIGK